MGGRFSRRAWLLMAIVVGLSVACASYYWLQWHRRVAALNGLRDEINHIMGTGMGPLASIGARAVVSRKPFENNGTPDFRDQVTIAFVMAPDGLCHHVVLKFPDGSFFDGGNGLISEAKLLALYGQDDRIEEIVQFDLSQSVGR